MRSGVAGLRVGSRVFALFGVRLGVAKIERVLAVFFCFIWSGQS